MSHTPKHAMLLALDQARLSKDGQRRAQAHLDRCELCRSAQAGLERYSELKQATRELDVPVINFDRMALALRQEARQQAKAASHRTLWSALAVAAALALAVFGASRWAAPVSPQRDTVASPSPASQPKPSDSASSSLPKTHGAGSVASSSTASGASSTLIEGAVLRADAGELRIELWEGTEVRLERDTLARVEKLQQHQARLRIERGVITSQVAPLRTGDSFEIAVNELVVAVRGTRFVVERGADGLAQVTLNEGKVDVTRGDRLVARLLAPARWSESRGEQLDNQHRLHDANAPVMEGTVSERPSRIPTPRASTDAHNTAAVPTALKHLFARATPLLRACHEQSRRVDPATPNAVRLVLAIDNAGKVQSVDVKADGATVPDVLASCMRSRVMSWHIPLPPSGAVTLEIPLSFASSP